MRTGSYQQHVTCCNICKAGDENRYYCTLFLQPVSSQKAVHFAERFKAGDGKLASVGVTCRHVEYHRLKVRSIFSRDSELLSLLL